MSPQMIELLIFAGIAFFVINKLISKLGSTSDNDPAKQKFSFFGEAKIKDVTYTAPNSPTNLFKKNFFKKAPLDTTTLDGFIIEENREAIITGLESITVKLPSFQPSKFLNSAKMAFELIIEAANDEDIEELLKLVDKRYVEKFHIFSENYGEFVHGGKLEAKISESYSFANNIFIKVLFSGKKITSKLDFLKEEWTFSRNLISNEVNWFLTNVESATEIVGA
ncbi:hypothetical protein [Candidatus Tisiphia endosymbiont of Beris chalybata]|uniref:hypothetical protein n=1 Tax=Candidatus Tisiphia endosymbiont of Beris chalybata TaxID=3066262 RepID=UPI00312CAE25